MELLDENFNIIPLPRDSKIPKIKWEKYQEHPFPKREIQLHKGNFAVICGRASSNLLVLDIDMREGCKQDFGDIYKEMRKELGNIIDTQMVSTPHGVHLYYLMDDFEVNRKANKNAGYNKNFKFVGVCKTRFAKFLKGFDILGNNGYAIIPPSQINGDSYNYMNQKEIRILKKKEFDSILAFFLYKKIKKLRQPFLDILNGKLEIQGYAVEVNQKGNEHVYWKNIYRECYHQIGLKPEDLFEGLSKNQPAFDLEKTKTQLLYDYHDYREKPLSNDKMKEYFPTYYQKVKKKEVDMFASDKIEKEEIEDTQLNYYLRDLVLEKYHIKVLYETGEYCLYKNGIYQRHQKKSIEQIIGWTLEQEQLKFSIVRQNTILELVAQACYTSIEEFDRDVYLLNLNNGLLNIKTKEFRDHDHKILQFRRIQVNYNPDARCPIINTFLRDIFHEDDIPFIKEFFALCLTPIMKYQKALLLHGGGNNGKTTFLNFMTLFIGKSNRSSISLVELANDFYMAQLEDMLINIVSDIDSTKMKIRPFKLYVGDEAVLTVNRKFKDPYKIKPTAKLIYSCNNTFPRIPSDTDKGFFRKWSIVECPYEFDENEDREILLKLLDEDEKSGFLNELLLAFGDLYLRDGFEKRYDDFQMVKNLWFIKSNSFLQFLQEVGEVGQYETVAKNINNQYWEIPETVLDRFNDYRLHILNQPAVEQKTLTNLIKYTPDIRVTRRVVNLDGKKRQTKIYAGLKLTDKPMTKTIKMFDEKEKDVE